MSGMETVTFLGGPVDGEQREIPEPVPSAIRVQEPYTASELWSDTGMMPADVTYVRQAAVFLGRKHIVYVAAGHTLVGWRPVTHRCRTCGGPVEVAIVDATLHGDYIADRRRVMWGRHEACPKCGSTAAPERDASYGEEVSWTVGEVDR